MLKLFDTMSRKKLPIENHGPITVYTCGPTVYLDPQIGNWRTFIFYDTLIRTLRAEQYDVRHVLNITDVGHLVSDGDEGDDKLDRQAKLQRKTAWEIAEHYTDNFFKGMSELNILTPTKLPKATEHISEQIEMIKELEASGHTYVIDDGVYFDVNTLSDYGKLVGSRAKQDENYARVEKNNQKRNAQDFALWKFSPRDVKRDMEWDSPWGVGFPGWHIECSAMAKKYLGKTITIHAGGVDHIPVHHTNEIAQSEAANGCQFAKIWLHGEFMKVDGTKMSKSLGNSFTLEDLKTKGFSPLDFRMLVLQGHYRTETNFTWENLNAARIRRAKLLNLADLRWQEGGIDSTETLTKLVEAKEKFISAMADELNTPEALSVVSSIVELSDNGFSGKTRKEFLELLLVIDSYFGLNLIKTSVDITDEQRAEILRRQQAKIDKNYTESDMIRANLSSSGIELLDRPTGTLWQRDYLSS